MSCIYHFHEYLRMKLIVVMLIYLQLLAIRDELLDTFKKRQKGVMDMEEVKLTSDSLHRLNFLPASLHHGY